MTRTRIISILVIIISLVAIVWSLGGGMFSPREFDFRIEGNISEGELPDTSNWNVERLDLDSSEGRYIISGKATRSSVIELRSEEVSYCSALFIEPGKITVEEHRATGTISNNARTAMLVEVDSLAWSHPEGEYSQAYKQAYDSLARKYISQNHNNLYGGWLAEHISRELSIDDARTLYAALTSGVRRTDAVAPLRTRIERNARSQEGRRISNLPADVQQLLDQERYVLIDFWASWNHNDRYRAHNLAEITAPYEGTKLSICRVSMDNSPTQQRIASQDESSSWLQLSGIEGCGAEIVEKLSIESLPTSYLLAPDGRIVARTATIEELTSVLEELFSQKN